MPKIKGTPKTSTERQKIFAENMKKKGFERLILYVPHYSAQRIRDLVDDIRNEVDEVDFVQGYRQGLKDMANWNKKMFVP